MQFFINRNKLLNDKSPRFGALFKKSRPISRILSGLTIYLGLLLPTASNRLPSHIGRATLKRGFTWRCTA